MACHQTDERIVLIWIQAANDIGLAFDPYCRATVGHDGAAIAAILLDLLAQNRIYWFPGDEESQPGYIARD